MRLFAAVDLDAAARDAIGAEQRRLSAAAEHASPLRWVKPDHMHLTLVFLGEVEEARVTAVVDAIGRAVDQPPIDLVLSGFGMFPPRGAPRVLWLGVGAGENELRALQRGLADRAVRAGVRLEERSFSPHLTLARWKASRPSDRTLLAPAMHDRIVSRLRVDHATLYQSRLSPAGPAYTELARATLSG